jgi:ribosome-binding factor A
VHKLMEAYQKKIKNAKVNNMLRVRQLFRRQQPFHCYQRITKSLILERNKKFVLYSRKSYELFPNEDHKKREEEKRNKHVKTHLVNKYNSMKNDYDQQALYRHASSRKNGTDEEVTNVDQSNNKFNDADEKFREFLEFFDSEKEKEFIFDVHGKIEQMMKDACIGGYQFANLENEIHDLAKDYELKEKDLEEMMDKMGISEKLKELEDLIPEKLKEDIDSKDTRTLLKELFDLSDESITEILENPEKMKEFVNQKLSDEAAAKLMDRYRDSTKIHGQDDSADMKFTETQKLIERELNKLLVQDGIIEEGEDPSRVLTEEELFKAFEIPKHLFKQKSQETNEFTGEEEEEEEDEKIDLEQFKKEVDAIFAEDITNDNKEKEDIKSKQDYYATKMQQNILKTRRKKLRKAMRSSETAKQKQEFNSNNVKIEPNIERENVGDEKEDIEDEEDTGYFDDMDKADESRLNELDLYSKERMKELRSKMQEEEEKKQNNLRIKRQKRLGIKQAMVEAVKKEDRKRRKETNSLKLFNFSDKKENESNEEEEYEHLTPRQRSLGKKVHKTLEYVLEHDFKDIRASTIQIKYVEMARDFRSASVKWVSTKSNILYDEMKEINNLLNKRSGFLASKVGQAAELRYAPKFKFYFDARLDDPTAPDYLKPGLEQKRLIEELSQQYDLPKKMENKLMQSFVNEYSVETDAIFRDKPRKKSKLGKKRKAKRKINLKKGRYSML